ncbi:MAG: hypothetical protein COV07_04565 [Candidatus Vogelbacteria bacterium CG10_big_fil_rev_8_21_14_0_10_45_14]|uniref:Uncharacterized protein n=1 Tax=Candidatus Vogelbacteria bacterium CG10_big_fil_rev_8_21_14_0_10_45_14 TaxID=1975042 RepID=A0A2H0RI24_9BACT|nr:MAG: hypothetical protein COV07_04565 [Candidatus Vogelbacteria bacterium CG10_big_fil_rev_8_21_14_0_10_45_14]
MCPLFCSTFSICNTCIKLAHFGVKLKQRCHGYAQSHLFTVYFPVEPFFASIELMENFLENKYHDLAGSKPVERAVQKEKRESGKAPHERSERIGAYLERLEHIIKDKRGFGLLKYKILERYVTKTEEIPESYWKAQHEEARRRGEGGDWDNATKEQKEEVKRKHAEHVLSDQRSSLEQWVDYFGSSDSDYIPNDLKYWIFRSIINLQELVKKKEGDKEYIEFPKRSRGTVKPFPDINHEALAYVADAVLKKLGGEQITFEYDIEPADREAFARFLAKEDFAKLYAWANELMNPIPEHLLPVTEGRWIKYAQGSDPQALVQTIRGKGTGWCTAGLNTAKTQLTGGDFYVYYTADDQGALTIPRLAIRMQGQSQIAEDPRGIAYKQNVDPYMGTILDEKLKEFGKVGEVYKKKSSDMGQLTEVENKMRAKQELTKTDLVFLYELEKEIEGFGYQQDPRIKELRSERNAKEDALIVFDCASDQIAWKKEDVTNTTKAYCGPLYPSVFKQNFEHVYPEFPEGHTKRFDVTTSGQTGKKEREELDKQKINVSPWSDFLLKSEDFKNESRAERHDLIRLSVKDLGFPDGATTAEIFGTKEKDFKDGKAYELGLDLCPPDVGPALRLAYSGTERFWIALKPISDRYDNPLVFSLSSDESGLWLDAYYANPGSRWDASLRFVFRLRKSNP